MPQLRALAPLLLLLPSLAACPSGRTRQPPDDGSATTAPADEDDGGASRDDAPDEAETDGEAGEDGGGLPGPPLPSGAACDTTADCAKGEVCEGLGCAPGQGRCAPPDRMCTRDLAVYCGCEGEEFQGSGSCPGDRFAYRGPCEPKLEDGQPCTDGRQCSSGQCIGAGLEGCGRGAEGVCGTTACTADEAAYCGCNNFEFSASGTCPNRQFAYRGPCEDRPD